jgi:DNA mismatch repair protein MutL
LAKEFSTNQSHEQDIKKSKPFEVKYHDKNILKEISPDEKASHEIRLFTKALEPLARTDLRNDVLFDGNNRNIITSNSTTIENDGSSTNGLDQLQVSYSVPEKNTRDYLHHEQVLSRVSESNDENANLELVNMKYIGQAFLTYIILQNGEELVLVDQHAAHERILYEKLQIKFESQENTTQLLLEPVVIQLQAFELNLIKSKEVLFNNVGFVFEDFGNNSIIIRGIPYLVEGYSPKDLFLELADKIGESVKPVTTPLADEIIHTIACKAAIKANKKLNDKEVYQLLSDLANTGRRFTCPHGRPTVIRLTKYEIEKMFKRII